MERWALLAFVLLHLLLAIRPAPYASRNPEEMGGHYQGDMVLLPEEQERGAGSRLAFQRWANGVVPYLFASNISRNNSLLIVSMMREMEALTLVNNTKCITFREKNAGDTYFITIFNGTGCYAPVGSRGSSTSVRGVSLMDSPTATCMISGIIQHELAHVLGSFHEQSRPDRDTYVSIQWDNIEPANAYNFDKYTTNDVDTLMTPYDYGSVMHYANNSFAVNISGPTIVPVFNSSAVLGQRIQLSPIDVLEIQRYYGCVLTPLDPSATTTSRTTSSANRCSLQSSWTMSLISILSLLHVSKSTHSSAVHH